MRTLYFVFLLLVLTCFSFAEEELPASARDLLKKRQDAIERIDEKLIGELAKIREHFVNSGDRKAADSVNALIQDFKGNGAKGVGDPLVGTVWIFYGIKKQKLNEFTFLAGGKVKCQKSYKNATWRRLSGKSILFGYGEDESWIVFELDGGRNTMTGYHKTGRVRYLKKEK